MRSSYRSPYKRLTAVSVAVLASAALAAEPGGADEPLRYVGKQAVDMSRQDGGLRPVVGVQSYQVMRANRSHPESSDGFGWTYHHSAVLAYHNGKFYLATKVNLVDEDIGSGQMLLYSSADGRQWTLPRPAFPLFEKGEANNISYRRPFYVAPNGRMLLLCGYGDNGLCARELRSDDSLGPIQALTQRPNAKLPYYKTSSDQGLVDACNAFLHDDLIMPFWYEMLGPQSDLYKFKFPIPTPETMTSIGTQYFNMPLMSLKNFGKGATIFHRKDGATVMVWKFGLATISKDDGKSWSPMVKLPTLRTRMQMAFGTKTSDGRYALLYDPDPGDAHGERRYPLALVSSDDGITFDDMGVVHGEVPDQRYAGKAKEIGPSYVNGVYEGQGNPPGNDLWVCYSVSKEDVWVSRIPVPIRTSVSAPVNDTFDAIAPGAPVTDWNTYSPKWGAAAVVEDFAGSANHSLELLDREPYDYARATRVFPASKRVTIRFKLEAEQIHNGTMQVEVNDAAGARAARVYLRDDGMVWALDDEKPVAIARYTAHDWMAFELSMDTTTRKFTVTVKTVDGDTTTRDLAFPDGMQSVERITFRTGDYRQLGRGDKDRGRDLPDADEPVTESVYRIDDVVTSDHAN